MHAYIYNGNANIAKSSCIALCMRLGLNMWCANFHTHSIYTVQYMVFLLKVDTKCMDTRGALMLPSQLTGVHSFPHNSTEC